MYKQESIDILKLWHHEKGEAIISQYNGNYRVYDGDSQERFYSSVNNAVKDLISEGYILTMRSFFARYI